MIQIEVRNTQVNEKTMTYREGPRAGQQSVRFQQAARLHGHYVQGFKAEDPATIIIELGEKGPQNPVAIPYQVGFYVVSDECFYPDKFAGLTLGRLKLQPLSQFLSEIQSQFKLPPLAAAAKAA